MSSTPQKSQLVPAIAVALALSAGLAIGAWALWPELSSADVLLFFSLVGSFFAVEVVPLPMPRGASFRLVGGVAVAAILITEPALATAAYLAGGSIALLLEQSDRVRAHAVNLGRRLLTMLVIGVAYYYVVDGQTVDARSLTSMVIALVAGALFIVADVVGWAFTNEGSGGRGGRGARSLLQLFGGVYLGQVSVGVVLAVVYPSLGALAFLVLVVLMLTMQHTFGLLLRIRTAYTRTVSALSRVAEMSEGGNTGHGERVAAVAAGVGRRLGLDSATLERLTLASLVHDIGLISMDEDDESRSDKRAIALSSGELVSRVSFLAGLSPIVRRHYLPYEDYLDLRETDGLLSRILHIACEFDEVASAPGAPDEHHRALDVLLQSTERGEFDPSVIAALRESVDSGEV